MDTRGARALELATISMSFFLAVDPTMAFIAPAVIPRAAANAAVSSAPRMVAATPQKLVTTKSDETFAEAKVSHAQQVLHKLRLIHV